MGNLTPWGEMLSALSNPYRRQLLVALLEHNPQDGDDRDPLDILSVTEEPEVLETELVHTHLPKLDDMGFITWNRETNQISKGPRWEEIAPLLELVYAHQDELPEGFL
jgi:hypothetical protein